MKSAFRLLVLAGLREAVMNARLAQLESELRSTRLWMHTSTTWRRGRGSPQARQRVT